jgi:hypothetical protein
MSRASCPEWRAKVFAANDITMDEPTHGFRYIVGRGAEVRHQPFEELFLAVSVNAAAALFVVADSWGPQGEVQVIGLEGDNGTYTFNTGRGGEPPIRLAEADVVKEDDSKGAPWEASETYRKRMRGRIRQREAQQVTR